MSTNTETLPRFDRGPSFEAFGRAGVVPTGAETERVPSAVRVLGPGTVVEGGRGGTASNDSSGAARQRAWNSLYRDFIRSVPGTLRAIASWYIPSALERLRTYG